MLRLRAPLLAPFDIICVSLRRKHPEPRFGFTRRRANLRAFRYSTSTSCFLIATSAISVGSDTMPPRRSKRLVARAEASGIALPVYSTVKRRTAKIVPAPLTSRQPPKRQRGVKSRVEVESARETLEVPSEVHAITPVERTAVGEVFDVAELRSMIFGQVDRKTLVGAMRVNRSFFVGAVEIIYHKVLAGQGSRMRRSTVSE